MTQGVTKYSESLESTRLSSARRIFVRTRAAAANRIALDLERVIGSDMDGFSYPDGSWA